MNPKRNTAGTVIASVIIITLVIISLAMSDYRLSEVQSSTLKILLAVCGISVAYCFIVGELVQNYSQMDKLWSILPIAYTWIIAVRDGLGIRTTVFALIVTCWGIRLTYNFARKGAYSIRFWEGKEDYRWAVVHGTKYFRSRIAWMAFDLFFISMYQNILVLGICLPSLICMGTDELCIWDIAASVLAVLFLVLETVADEYQWKFHQTKKRLLSEGGRLDSLPVPYDLGFNTTGPWNYMRHPNYLGEQGIWLSLYIFVIGSGAASAYIFHWSLVPSLLLVFLFMGSSALGESITSRKYPMYKTYTGRVFKYLPLRRFR